MSPQCDANFLVILVISVQILISMHDHNSEHSVELAMSSNHYAS